LIAAWRRRYRGLGAVEAFQPIPGGALLSAERGTVRIELLRDTAVRLRYAFAHDAGPLCSNATIADLPPLTDPEIEETDRELRLIGELAHVTVQKYPLRITVKDAGGHELLREAAGANGGAHGWRGGVAHHLVDPPRSRYFGLGQQAGPLERTGRRFVLWNTDPFPSSGKGRSLYSSFPNYLVLRDGTAHGVFYDNPHRSVFDFGAGRAGRITWLAAGGELRCYVIPGPRPANVLERYTRLTGRMPLPPRWALGYHQSRWSYYPASELYRLAEEFRGRRIPCDGIHLDIHYMNAYRVFTWHPERFPDPARLIADLELQGFKVTAIVDPGVKVDEAYEVYTAGRARHAFVQWPDGREYVGRVWPGRVMFPDFSCPDTRDWWGGLHRALLDSGIRGIWNDMNEPSIFCLRRTMPDALRFRNDGHGAGHDELHNQYGLLMARASWEGYRRVRPDRRPFVLTRSGFAGVQRYAAMWTGDNLATWDHLRLALPMLLGLGLSGVPFVGADIGGFFGSPSPELYTRFLQLGVLMPFCRTHSYFRARAREPWCFSGAYEQANRELIELRYRFLPQLYTAFWQHARDGRPVMRPLFWEHPDDPAAFNAADQFFLGDHLLAAPVLHRGRDQRNVYLPAGRWYRLDTGEAFAGGRWVTVSAPRVDPVAPRPGAGLAGLPIFVRAGAVVTTQDVQQYVGERQVEELECHVWDGGGARSELYEDPGDGYGHEAGAWRLTRFQVIATPEALMIRLACEGDPAIGARRFRVFAHSLRCAPSEVQVGGAPVPFEWRDSGVVLTLDPVAECEIRVVRGRAVGRSGGRAGGRTGGRADGENTEPFSRTSV
jgi:alpha-glucosidase